MTLLPPPIPAYPSDVFTGLLGEILHSLATNGAAAELAGTEIIAFASLLTQGMADVRWPNGVESPIGVNCLLVAPSGYGKSLIYKTISAPIEQYLMERSLGNDPTQHVDFFLEDATKEAILQSLSNWPVAGLFTDEAGQLKKLFRDAPTLAKLLDGSPLRSARVSTGRIQLRGHRLCMLLMEQPEVFESMKVLLGASKGGVGLINRFFVSHLNGLATGGSPHQIQLPAHIKQEYETKVHGLLEQGIEYVKGQTSKRPVLPLSAEAAHYLIGLDQGVRRKCALGAPWFPISEYVLRHVERVLRLAGVFHAFENGTQSEISVDTLQRAEILGNWYIDSFARAVYVPPKQTQAELDAAALEHAFFRYYHSTGISQVRQFELRAHAVNLGLTPNRFTRALAALGGQGKVCVFLQRNTPWVALTVFPSFPYQ